MSDIFYLLLPMLVGFVAGFLTYKIGEKLLPSFIFTFIDKHIKTIRNIFLGIFILISIVSPLLLFFSGQVHYMSMAKTLPFLNFYLGFCLVPFSKYRKKVAENSPPKILNKKWRIIIFVLCIIIFSIAFWGVDNNGSFKKGIFGKSDSQQVQPPQKITNSTNSYKQFDTVQEKMSIK